MTSLKAMVSLLVLIFITVIMIPVIQTAIDEATNLSATVVSILSLIPTLIVLGVLVVSVKQSGLS